MNNLYSILPSYLFYLSFLLPTVISVQEFLKHITKIDVQDEEDGSDDDYDDEDPFPLSQISVVKMV